MDRGEDGHSSIKIQESREVLGKMKFMGRAGWLAISLLFAGSVSAPSNAQALSPPRHAVCKFADGKSIAVNYSSPRMRGRKIFGDLVPYGEVWRAGADDATSFTTTVDLVAAGKTIPAGRYTLFTLPTPAKWTLIVSKQIGEWGIPYPGMQYDLTRAEMKVSKLPAPVENFTIGFDQAGTGYTMKLDWETTRASIEITEKR
jgi:hypothetical protein